jgi:hypothetical protein
VPVRTSSSRQLARAAPGSALIQFCFHFDICLRATLDTARPHHHGAVGGFFSAPQDRAASTSFEGGVKSGGSRHTETLSASLDVCPSLERGSQHHLLGGTIKSDGCAVAAIWRSPISSDMKMNISTSRPVEMRSYVQLQREIHEALRKQHPEWIEPNGDCPTCESYESRFAELLDIFLSNERKSAA